MSLRQTIPTEELFRKFRKSFHVIIVGDACMNPYELFVANGAIDYWSNEQTPGIQWLKRLKEHFPSTIWLNPEPENYWQTHPTIHAISKLIKMYPLTIEGLTRSINDLKRDQVQPKLIENNSLFA